MADESGGAGGAGGAGEAGAGAGSNVSPAVTEGAHTVQAFGGSAVIVLAQQVAGGVVAPAFCARVQHTFRRNQPAAHRQFQT
jgi:hypothetical protein